MFANQGVPSGMILIRNDCGSHNPDDKMDLGDFMMGTEVLYQALTAMTGRTILVENVSRTV